MNNILEILIENATNERLDEIAFLGEEYCIIDAQLNTAQQEYANLNLSEEDTKIIDKMLCLSTAHSARYSTLAYKQGLEDAVSLLKFMGII